MVEFSIFGLILLFSCFLAAGVVGGVVHTWSLRARTYSLEDRVAILEGTLQREVKTRAGQERWKKPDKDLELLNAVNASPSRRPNWWEVPARVK